MAVSVAIMRSLQERAVQAEKTIAFLKQQLEQLRKCALVNACAKEEEKYKVENETLRNEIILLRTKLIEVETRNGIKQVPLPGYLKSSLTFTHASMPVVNGPPRVTDEEKQPLPSPKKVEQQSNKQEKAQKKGDKPVAMKGQSQPSKGAKEISKVDDDSASGTVDVSRLNMKIGKIVAVDKHPDADSLYVEQVDLGEGKNRIIISGLVKHVSIEQMQDRLAVFLTNLKPAKMRGVLSEGMVMCASTSEKVEIIEPPPGAEIGDKVTVEGFPGEPDEMLNPKKKTWETILPDLKTNEEGFATYKGALWVIEGKGHFKAPTVRNGQIK